MSVYTLSGIGDKAKRQAKKAVRKEKRAEKKEARQEKREEKKTAREVKREERKEKIKAKVKKLGGAAKKIGFAASRGSFLALVRLNVFGFATKLSKSIAKDENKVKDVWVSKFGGDFNKLKDTVTKGKAKKENRDKNAQVSTIEGISEPVTGATVAAAITAATPVIVMVVKALKQILPNQELGDLSSVADQLGSEYEQTNGTTVEEDLKTVDESSVSFAPSTRGLIGAAVGAGAGYMFGKGKKKMIFAAAGAAGGYFAGSKLGGVNGIEKF